MMYCDLAPRCRLYCLVVLAIVAFPISNLYGAEIRFDPAFYTVDESSPGLALSLLIDVPECTGQVHIEESSLVIRATSGGSNPASPGVDFIAREELLPLGVTGIAPLGLGRVIGDIVIDDTTFEGDVPETFVLEIEVPAGLRVDCVGTGLTFPLGTGEPATVEIIDNDEEDASEIAFTQASATVSESDTSATFFLTRRNGTRGTVTASLVEDSERLDIAPLTLTWADGQSGPMPFVVTFDDNTTQGDDTTIPLTFTTTGDVTLGAPATLSLTIEDDDVASDFVIVSGNNQIGTVNTVLGQDLRVRALDGNDQPIAQAEVDWQPGTLMAAPLSSTTDADGVASTTVTLGSTPGTFQIRATLRQSGLSAVFTVTARQESDSTTDAISSACSGDPGDLDGVCGYFFDELDPGEQEQVLEEIRPEEVAAQGTISQDSPRVQQSNIGKRLAALRGSGSRRTVQQLALDLRGTGLDPGTLIAGFKRRHEPAFDLDAALRQAAEERLAQRATHRVAAQALPCANLRPGPSLAHQRLACLAPGIAVEVLDRRNDWSHVQLANGRQGWVASHLVPEVSAPRRAAKTGMGPSERFLDRSAMASDTAAPAESYDTTVAGSTQPADQTGSDPAGADPAADAAETDAPRLGIFVNGSLSIGDRPDTDRESGFDFETLGLTTGVDYRVREGLFFGAAVGYLNSDTDLIQDGGRLDAEGLSLSAYGLKFWKKGLYLQGVAGYGKNDYDLLRNIDLVVPFPVPGTPGKSRFAARGDTEGTQTSLALELGYDRSLGKTSLTAFGRLSAIDASIDGYRESGDPDGSGFYLEVLDQDVESLISQIGLDVSWSVSYAWGVLFPQLRASYLHEFEDDSRLVRARFLADPDPNNILAVPTDPPDRDFFNLGIGLAAQFQRGVSAYLLYDTDVERDDLDVHNVTLGLRFEID
ncbi:MAG: autotransporter domain-containing protein [Acidobacteriota bacterium]